MEEPQLLQMSPDDNPTPKPPVPATKGKLSKREIGLIVFVIVAILGAGIYAYMTGKNKEASISSFAECVAAGNEVMESYPERCSANGQSWSNPDQTAPVDPSS